MFELWKAVVGFNLNGVNYDLADVDRIAPVDPVKKHLIRGASGKNKEGVIWREGMKDPYTLEVTIVNCPADVFNLLQKCFNEDERIKVYCIDDKNGNSMTFNNCIIRDNPMQTEISEDAGSHSFVLAVESFDYVAKFKKEA